MAGAAGGFGTTIGDGFIWPSPCSETGSPFAIAFATIAAASWAGTVFDPGITPPTPVDAGTLLGEEGAEEDPPGEEEPPEEEEPEPAEAPGKL